MPLTRRLALARRGLVLAGSAMVLTSAACSRGKDAGGSPGKGGTDSAAPAPRPRTGTGAPLPGTLQKPLTQYSAEDFYTLVRSLGYGGGASQTRKCRGAAGCGVTGGKVTTARVDAVDGQDSLSATSVPANGVIAAKAGNTGQYQEARYGMLPRADHEYYVVVLPAADGKARWSMQQLVTTPGARTLTEVGTGEFFPCAHTSKGKNFRANFYSCSDAHLSPDSIARMPLLFQGSASDPIWIRCETGCCTVI